MSRRAIISVLTFASFILITLIVILLAQGCRIDHQSDQYCDTGIIEATSVPTGAKVTIDGKNHGATDTTINSLNPGSYLIEMHKDGYFPWSKQVSLDKNKVVSLDALLIPINPSLAPVSATSATRPVLSPDGQKLAYAVTTGTSTGIWMLDLSTQPFNLSRKPTLLLPDTEVIRYSSGQLSWSPTSKELLISLDEAGLTSSFLIHPDNQANPTPVNAQEVEQAWIPEQLKYNQDLGSSFPKDAQQLITEHNDTIAWSPDNLKFLYVTDEAGQKATYVYNKENKSLIKAATNDPTKFSVVRWYADGQHLMTLEKDKLESTNGTISLMGMDGSNKQQVFNGTLIDDALYTSLSGAKLIILTSFNLQTPVYYLYSINLR